MRNLIFSVFAIGVAAVAAMTATTAMLNTPVPRSSAVVMQNLQAEAPPATPAENPPATSGSAPPAAPGAGADGAAKPASGAPNADTRAATEDDEVDKDPYEGIAPEELPPDLQYSADSSVSFPTNI
jgi:hypothetical protein